MSSPGARQRRRRDQYQAPRSRRELVIAVGVAAGIVLGTAVMVWLLRPGGMADRQPRSSWLVAAALVAAIVAVWLVLRAAKDREINASVWLAGSLAGILVVAVVAGIFWPDGLLRHTPPPITVPPTSTPSATTTTAPGATTTAPGSATTQPATATTTATTTAPTSSSP
jgi:cytochrome bd-type quinol oxidase subunit 2